MREPTDIDVDERREILDVILKETDRGEVDINFSLLVVLNDGQKFRMSERYNELVQPQHHLHPRDAEQMFTSHEDGHLLNTVGMFRVYPPREHLLDTSEHPVESRRSFIVESGEVELTEHVSLSDYDLEVATNHFDWKELVENAVEHGHEPSKEAGALIKVDKGPSNAKAARGAANEQVL